MKVFRAALPFILTTAVYAYSSGAGACPGGAAAVNGPHVSGYFEVTETTLTAAGFEVAVDNVGIFPGEAFQVQSGVEHTLTVQAIDNQVFRGALLRIEQGDGSSVTLTPDEFSRSAGACAAPVLGVTHTDNSDKTRLGGILRTESTEPITLDVTIVEQNGQTGSIFSYDQYSIEVLGTPEETSAPTSSPTKPPSTITLKSTSNDPPASDEATPAPVSEEPRMYPASRNSTSGETLDTEPPSSSIESNESFVWPTAETTLIVAAILFGLLGGVCFIQSVFPPPSLHGYRDRNHSDDHSEEVPLTRKDPEAAPI